MSIRQRLYPSPDQEQVLSRHCSDARFVYNIGLEQRNFWRKDMTAKISLSGQCRELTEARQAFSWLAEGSSLSPASCPTGLGPSVSELVEGNPP